MPATREVSPRAVKVQLANVSSVNSIESRMNEDPSAEWWMERKLDGFRLVAVFLPDYQVIGLSRAGRDQDLKNRLPALHKELFSIGYNLGLFGATGGLTVLDGELIPGGVPASESQPHHFRRVTEVMKSDPPRAAMLQAMDHDLCYAVFDLLWWKGQDVRPWRLYQRRDRIRRYMMSPMSDHMPPKLVSLTSTYDVDVEVVSSWMAAGGEGAIVKNASKPYSPGRSVKNGWFKIKDRQESDVVLMGYTDARWGKDGKFFKPDGTPMIGAIRYGQYHECRCGGVGPSVGAICQWCFNSGMELVERGQCSGLLDDLRLELTDNGDAYIGKVFVVKHMGIQKEKGGFRHPNFGGFRDDKLPEECTWD